MGHFDPSTFLDVTFTDANDTVSVPVPAGEYQATAGEPKMRGGVSDKSGQQWAALDINWEIDGSSLSVLEGKTLKEITGRDKCVVKQSIMLDLTPGGGIDTGKGMNVAFGRLREALDLNKPGEPFSPRMIQGRMAKVSVAHRVYEGQTFADVKAVAKA